MRINFRLRFSLRSLLLAMLTLGAAAALWRNYDPWRIQREFDGSELPHASLQLSKDGKWILADAMGREIGSDQEWFKSVLWKVETGHARVLIDEKWTNPGDSNWYRMLSEFSRDSSRLVAGFAMPSTSKLNFWDLQTQSEIVLPDYKPEKHPGHVRFSNNGEYLLHHRSDGTGLIYLKKTNEVTARLPPSEDLRFTQSGEQVVSIGEDNLLRIFDAANGREKLARKASWALYSIGHASNQSIVLYASPRGSDKYPLTGKAIYMDMKNPDNLEYFDGRLDGISSDESLAIFSTSDEFRMVDIKRRSVLWRVPSKSQLFRFEFIGDSNRVFSTPNAAMYDVETGKLIYEIGDTHTALLLPDHTRVLCAKRRSDILSIFDVSNGESLQHFPHEVIGQFNHDVFSADSRHFITQNTDSHVIHLWTRHRPERWWGLAWLPEFWLLIALAAAFVWSLHRDRKPAHAN